MIGDIIVLIVLVALNGFFVAGESAIVSLNPAKFKAKQDKESNRFRLIKKIADEPSSYLAAMQIGISLTGLFSGAFAASAFSGGIQDSLLSMGINIPRPLLILFVIMIFGYLMLIFGETFPKRLAAKNGGNLLNYLIMPIIIATKLASPFVKILYHSTKLLYKLFGEDPNHVEDDITEEEIRMMVDAGGEVGSIDKNEKQMINNVLEFDNIIVGDICTRRKDIEAIDIKAGFGEVVRVITKEKYSRIPVYEDDIDNIVGILHIKDLLNDIFEWHYSGTTDIDVRDIMRKPCFVPLSKKSDELFYEMQKSKIHMAIVIDEYGGTVGLITMEDLIEEVMGNILDEYDEEEQPDIEMIDDNTYSVSGMASVDVVANFFDVALPVSEYDTISGFIIGQIGKIPKETERPEIEFNGLIFKVFKVYEKRITDVIVVKV